MSTETETRKPYQRYTELFKLEVLSFYYQHGENKKLTSVEFGIDHSCIRDWLLKYGSQENVVSLQDEIDLQMKKRLQHLPEDPMEAKAAYEKLQQELEHAMLERDAYRLMVEEAEKTFNIPIRKNPVPNSHCATQPLPLCVSG